MNAANYETLLAEIQAKGYEHPDIVAKMNQMSEEEIDHYMMFESGSSDTDEVRRILDLYYDAYELGSATVIIRAGNKVAHVKPYKPMCFKRTRINGFS